MVTQPIHRVHLRLVEGLILLQLLASLAGSGSPVFAQAAPGRPFNMITLGDSIIWGQGLPESMKFRTLVANWLQSQYGSSRKVVQWTTHSHSGAVTGWGAYPTDTCPSPQNCNDPDSWYVKHPKSGYTSGIPYPGEVPFDYPSISVQIGMTVNDLKSQVDPANVDLVLLDGGINDLSANNILDVWDPTKTEWGNGPNWVRTKTNQLCLSHMQRLLPQVTAQFPNAVVIVTGYFPMVSGQTDFIKLSEYLTVLGLAGEAGPDAAAIAGGPDAALAYLAGLSAATVPIAAVLRDALKDRSQAFATTEFNGLTDLVTQENKRLGTPRVALAWPNFSDDNAYAAPNSYLFLLEDYLADEIRGGQGQAPAGDWNTLEGVAYYRGEECSIIHPSDPTCYAALVGHPNPKGAQAYAQAIINQLGGFSTKLGLPSLPTFAVELSSGTDASGPYVYIGHRQNEAPQADYSTQVPTWIKVTAVGAKNYALHGSIQLQPIPTAQQNALVEGLGNGQTGQKVYYVCLPAGTPVSSSSTHPSNLTAFRGNRRGCSIQVSVPGYADCFLQLDQTLSMLGGILPTAQGQCRITTAAVVPTTATGTPITLPNMANTGQLSGGPISNAGNLAGQILAAQWTLSATVCPTLDGKSCLPVGQGRPAGGPLMDIVSVTSVGSPVAGATVSVSGQPTVTATTNASGVAVVTHLACFAPGTGVPRVGQTRVPVRTPVACVATASMAGYQPASITLP